MFKSYDVYVTTFETSSAPTPASVCTYHYITVCKNGDKKHVLTKLIARTRFSDSDYLFSEINVNLSFSISFIIYTKQVSKIDDDGNFFKKHHYKKEQPGEDKMPGCFSV